MNPKRRDTLRLMAVIGLMASTGLISQAQAAEWNKLAFEGKVVVLMFWTTDCAVCRDQMPELRENIRGWADKPFELVLVSADKRMSDVDSYNAIVSQAVPVKQRFVQLWTGDVDYKSSVNVAQIPKNQLPLTYVLDKSGKVVASQSGRIPVAWWDFIADLL